MSTSRVGLAAGQQALVPERIFTTPLIGIVLYLFVTHSYRLPIAGAAVGLALVGLMMEGKPVRIPAFLGWFGLWLIWGLLTYTWSDYPAEVWARWLNFAKVWLIVFVAVNAIRTPAQLLAFAVAWLGMFALFPVRGTLFNIIFGLGEQGRYAWNFAYANPNSMAAYCLLLLALAVAVLRIAPTRWVRMAALAGIFILPVIMFFTQSRGGFLGLAIFVLLVFAGERAKLQMLTVGVAAAGIIALTAPAEVWDRIRAMRNLTSAETLGDADSSAEQRYIIWQVAQQIIKEHPAGGVGLGAYPKAHAWVARNYSDEFSFARGERDTHSTYLNVAAETGIPGLILFAIMLLSAILAARRTEKLLRRRDGTRADSQAMLALRAGLIGFLVCALFGGLHSEPALFFMMTVMVHYSDFLRARHGGPAGQEAGVPAMARGRGVA